MKANIKCKGLTEMEARELLTFLRKMNRRRRHEGGKSFSYEMKMGKKKHVTRKKESRA